MRRSGVAKPRSVRSVDRRAPLPFAVSGLNPQQGILVFTPSLQLIFMNEEAIEMSGRINRVHRGLAAKGVIPDEVLNLCKDLLSIMLSLADGKPWKHLQLERVLGPSHRPIRLRAFGLLASTGITESHILILLDEIAPSVTQALDQVRDRYHLTPRETATVEALLAGMTNKEIAVHLHIAQQTAKGHLKNIMVKTGTTTRTGILRLFIGFGQPPADPHGHPSSKLDSVVAGS